MSGAGLTCARQTIESMYIMWRTTGDSVWRDRAWDGFQALEREAKTESGYASLRNVAESPARKMDEQPRCVVLYEAWKETYEQRCGCGEQLLPR